MEFLSTLLLTTLEFEDKEFSVYVSNFVISCSTTAYVAMAQPVTAAGPSEATKRSKRPKTMVVLYFPKQNCVPFSCAGTISREQSSPLAASNEQGVRVPYPNATLNSDKSCQHGNLLKECQPNLCFEKFATVRRHP